jgi:hypothetical protein
MNFTDTLEDAEKNVELKYCEGCGGLFLRAPGAGIVYCGGCAAGMPGPESVGGVSSRRQPRKRGARLTGGPAREPKLQGSGTIECLQGVVTEEVWSC